MSARSVVFRALRGLIGLGIAVLSRTGPLEPLARRTYRSVVQRPAFMDQLPCPLSVDGHTLWYTPGRGSFTVRGLAMGTYEQPTVALFNQVVREGMTVLDVGAHIGYYSLVAASLVGPSGSVWAFEPDPENQAMLERNVAYNGCDERVRVVSSAVGDAPSQARLFQDGSDSGSSSLFQRGGSTERTVTVDVTSLDRWAERWRWPSVDVVKMDVEGAEAAALAGMTELSRRNPGMALIVEFNAEALEAAGTKATDFFDALRSCGFGRLSVIGRRGVRRLPEGRARERLARRSRWLEVNLYCRKG